MVSGSAGSPGHGDGVVVGPFGGNVGHGLPVVVFGRSGSLGPSVGTVGTRPGSYVGAVGTSIGAEGT